MLPGVTSLAARADMNGAGSVLSIFAIAPSASAFRSAAPSGTMSSSNTGTPALANWAAMPAPMTPAPMTVALRIECMAALLRLDPLENGGDALPAADALGGKRVPAANALQEAGRLADDAGAGGAQGVSQRYGAAVNIERLIPDA